MKKPLLLAVVLIAATSAGLAQADSDGSMSSGMEMMGMDTQGVVMNENTDELPPGCDSISGWKNMTVSAGKEYAMNFTGEMYTYDNRIFQFEPCTKLTVTFHNEDNVRHQWMVHDLPRSIYDGGMFHIGVTGPGNATGTFILPSGDRTLLVHCGVPQHMEKGMKSQIMVGGGDGEIPNIPGYTGMSDSYDYETENAIPSYLASALTGFMLASMIIFFISRRASEEEE